MGGGGARGGPREGGVPQDPRTGHKGGGWLGKGGGGTVRGRGGGDTR